MVNLYAILRAKREGPKSHRPLVGKPKQLSRRGFFGRMLGLGFGIALLDFGALSLAFLWPSSRAGFGGKVAVPTGLAEIKAQMASTKQPFYFAPGRFYLVPVRRGPGRRTKPRGLVAGGLMALYQRCVHLGCKVPFCITSQWFECPCHGSKYNRAGEYRLGPAPRGLDRFPLTVEGDVADRRHDLRDHRPAARTEHDRPGARRRLLRRGSQGSPQDLDHDRRGEP